MLRNNFPSYVKELFDQGGWMNDWEDGRNDADSLHHIIGRDSNSIYNAAPLNNWRSHQPEGRKNLPDIHSFEAESKYLKKTKRYLDKIEYKPKSKDLQFLEEYKEYYTE